MGIDLGSNVFIYSVLTQVLLQFFFNIRGFLADGLIKRIWLTKCKKKCKFNRFFWFGVIVIPNFIGGFSYKCCNIIELINICSGICAGGFGVNHADLGPKYTGSLVGIAGSIGMVAAIISPIVAGFILEITNSWSSIFYLCTFVLLFGGIFYLLLQVLKNNSIN